MEWWTQTDIGWGNVENFNNSSMPMQFDLNSVEDKNAVMQIPEDATVKRARHTGLRAVSETSSAFTKAKPVTKLSKKKEDALKATIKGGDHEDIEYLIRSIDKHNAGQSEVKCSSNNLLLKVDEGKKRSEWLKKIGFQSNSFDTLWYPFAELAVLFRLLKNNQQLYAVNANTPNTLGSKSTSSECLSPIEVGHRDLCLTAENLEDNDRRAKGEEKARRRSCSNPQALTINTTGLNEFSQPLSVRGGLAGNLQIVNPNFDGKVYASGSNSTTNSSRKYVFGRPRRNSTESDDSSERGAESPALFPDPFSPINGNRSRPGSCRRSVSPLEASLLESVRDKMTFGSAPTIPTFSSSIISKSNSRDESAAEDLSQQFVAGPINIFSTKKDLVASCAGLHSICEDEDEEHVLTQIDEHDSDAATVCVEESQEESLTSHMKSEVGSLSPPHQVSQSFFSPSGGGDSRPPMVVAFVKHPPAFAPAVAHPRPSIATATDGIYGPSSSLFGASVESNLRMSAKFAGHPQSPDDDFNMGSIKDVKSVAGDSRNFRAEQKTKAQARRLNQFHRSKTEPLAYSYSAATEGTPVQDRTNCHSQPNPHVVFNTPQAVFHAKWENSQPAAIRCIELMQVKVNAIYAALESSTVHRSPYYEEKQNELALGILNAAMVASSGGLRSSHGRNSSFGGMDLFASGSANHRSIRNKVQDEEVPDMPDDAAAGHCPISSLVSSRPSFGYDESARTSFAPLPTTGAMDGPIQTARLSLFRRVMSTSGSLTAMSSINTMSPLHPSTAAQSSGFNKPQFSSLTASNPSQSIVSEANKRIIKMKKSESKQRRMSRFPVGNKNLKAASAHDNSYIAESKQIGKDSTTTISPCAKAKYGTSTRSRRRLSMTLAAKQQQDSSMDTCSVSFESSVPRFSLLDASRVVAARGGAEKDADVSSDFSLLNETLPSVGRHRGDQDDEQQFDGIVLGGAYQHCFENGAPVVCAPGASDKRITDLTLHENNLLVLNMFLPKDNIIKKVDLGRDWQCRRASPCGYLVSKCPIESLFDGSSRNGNNRPSKKAPSVCYYFLSKHPGSWMTSSLHKNTSVTVASIPHHDSSFFDGDDDMFLEDPCMDVSMASSDNIPTRPRTLSKGLFTSHDSSVAMDDDDDDVTVGYIDEQDNDICLTQLDVSRIDEMHLYDDELEGEAAKGEAIRDTERAVCAAGAKHCMNSSLMAIVFSYLAKPIVNANSGRSSRSASPVHTEDMSALQTVCKAWALSSYMLIAQRLSKFQTDKSQLYKYDKWSRFVSRNSWGKFLSQGVCKSVYCVQNSNSGELEAVSIMDVNDLMDREMQSAVTQELQISILCSSLVTLRVCPNLVQVYSMFQSEFAEPVSLWDDCPRPQLPRNPSDVVVPKQKGLKKGNFQYIRMEFCSGGDVEELVRKNNQLNVPQVRQFLFQMCFALYTCRDQIALRHFDIKLLNFFVTSGGAACTSSSMQCKREDVVDMRIGFGEYTYALPLGKSSLDLIKLADFGTSAVGQQGLGDPISLQQFTTLENTPIEFLLCGSSCRQSYSADTFPLGLCFLHLLTGYEPYEELLREVRCPKYLSQRLNKIWNDSDVASDFYVVYEVLESLKDVADEQNEGDDNAATAPSLINVLYDTLYRYLVLFGAGGVEPSDCLTSIYAHNPVWTSLCVSLGLNNSEQQNKRMRNQSECIAQYQRDSELWSLRYGNHPKMASARTRLTMVGEGAMELLESMIHFDPSQRCSMKEALQNPIFACMRVATNCATADSGGDSGDVHFMHYHRTAGGIDDLPIL